MKTNYLFRGFWRLALLALLCLVIPVHAAQAMSERYDVGNNQRFGIGLQFGSVSGLSMKYYITPEMAFQAGMGGSQWGYCLNAELLFNMVRLAQNESVSIPFYIGGGVAAGEWENGYWGYEDQASNLNVHVPIGLAFEFHALPIDIFVQFEPGIVLAPNVYASFGSTMGARFFF